MAPRLNRCKPNLWHLFILLFVSMCIISLVFYSLNNYFENRYPNRGFMAYLPSETRQDYKADFRTLPHTLPGGRRRLVILVNSKWSHFDRRLAIRNTWAMNQNRFNSSVFFVVGDSDDESMASVTDEGAFFHDIIQPSVWESEQNMVLKLLAAFRFVESELDADFVMKTNDDVFVNLPEIMDFLQPYLPVEVDHIQNHMAEYMHGGLSDSDRPQRLIFGNRIQQATPPGDPKKSDFLAHSFWPKYVPFPDYVSGSGYIASFDVIRRFSICPKVVELLPLEDVYFTGVCRQHFGIPLEHNEKFAFRPRLKVPCLWKTKFITGGVKHHEMETVWNDVNKKSTPKC